MRCGDCFIIVYSITDYKTFEEAQSIFEFTKRIRGENAPVVCGEILGNLYIPKWEPLIFSTLGPDGCGVLFSGVA